MENFISLINEINGFLVVLYNATANHHVTYHVFFSLSALYKKKRKTN